MSHQKQEAGTRSHRPQLQPSEGRRPSVGRGPPDIRALPKAQHSPAPPGSTARICHKNKLVCAPKVQWKLSPQTFEHTFLEKKLYSNAVSKAPSQRLVWGCVLGLQDPR